MQRKNLKIVRFAFWLIRLRWYFIIGIIISSLVAEFSLKISFLKLPIILCILYLAIFNILSLYIVNNILIPKIRQSISKVNLLINVQITSDILILTILLHYSGGVENPLIIFYIFHIIISSFILKTKESIYQTSFALIMVGSMTFLEFWGILNHYPLEGFIITNMYQNLIYILLTGIIFIITSYFAVYIIRTIIRESRKNEMAYLHSNKMLRQKDKIKNEYVMRITHDIKGHVTAIHSCLNVLDKKLAGELTPQQEHFVKRAQLRIEMLKTFISNLTNITHRKLQLKSDKKPFDFIASLEGIIKTTEIYALQKNISINKEFDPGAPIIYGEQFSLEEVMSNIILNSIKYSPENTTILLRVLNRFDNILISITDEGIGIPKDELKHIFDEFYRASNAKQQSTNGSGIGLAITKQIIENHGGRIWAESEINQGSTFFIYLPKKI